MGAEVGKGAHAPSYLSQAPVQEVLHFVLMEVSAAGESHHCLIPEKLKFSAASFQVSVSLVD